MEMNVDIRVVGRADVPMLSQILAQSFVEEEFWNWAIGSAALNKTEQLEKLTYLFKVQAEMFSLPFGTAYLSKNHLAAALWTPPNQWNLTLIEQVKLLPHFLKIVGLKRIYHFLEVINQIQKLHPDTPHYYLQTIGVLANARGQGLSKHLILPIINQCDKLNIGAYLETATYGNIALYRHFGFEILHTIDNLPHDAPTVYAMWRKPR